MAMMGRMVAASVAICPRTLTLQQSCRLALTLTTKTDREQKGLHTNYKPSYRDALPGSSTCRSLRRSGCHGAFMERDSVQSLVIIDCIRNQTCALQILPTKAEFWINGVRAVKDREGVFVMGKHRDLVLHAENGMWKSTAAYKARLPVETPDVQFRKCPLEILSARTEIRYFIDHLATDSAVRI
jgi:hypothetical protein